MRWERASQYWAQEEIFNNRKVLTNITKKDKRMILSSYALFLIKNW